MKLTVKEAKLTGLCARNCANIQQILIDPVVASQRRQEIHLCPRAMLSVMLSLLYFLDFKSYNVYAVKPS